jgi:hypothetical protein
MYTHAATVRESSIVQGPFSVAPCQTLAIRKLLIAVQVHPGVIASDFLERAQFRGAEGEAARARMGDMLSGGMPGVVQQPQEIADAVWCAVEGRRNEVRFAFER